MAAVPAGFVRTYGDISPGAPRLAGAILSSNHDERLPWHRIVRADGSLAKGATQRALLEAEGVPFRGERVDMRVARLPEPDRSRVRVFTTARIAAEIFECRCSRCREHQRGRHRDSTACCAL